MLESAIPNKNAKFAKIKSIIHLAYQEKQKTKMYTESEYWFIIPVEKPPKLYTHKSSSAKYYIQETRGQPGSQQKIILNTI